MDVNWYAFLAVTLLAYVVPGPDFVVILRGATRNWRQGVAAAVGAQTGLLAHIALAAVGVSVVVAQHPSALTAIRVVGGLYLLYLGGRLVLSTFGSGAVVDHRTDSGGSFRAGLVTNITNPKVLLFFAAVLPQFVTSDGLPVTAQIAVLGVLDVLLGALPWAVVVLVGHRLGRVLARPTVRRWWDRTAGALLGGMGGALVVKGP